LKVEQLETPQGQEGGLGPALSEQSQAGASHPSQPL